MTDNKNPKIISMVRRDLAGYHANLHNGFDKLGIKNYFFFERVHPFYSHTKAPLLLEGIITNLNDFIFDPKKSKISKIIWFICCHPIVYGLKWILFFHFLRKYDVFIFGANYSPLGFYIDRIFLKLSRKIIVDVVSGTDVRPPYLNGGYIDTPVKKIYKDTLSKYKKIKRKLRYTTYLIDHLTVSQFHSKNYIPHLFVGFPFSQPLQKYIPQQSIRPFILHAPSNPKVKGTSIIRETISDLQKDYDFDYEELLGLPNKNVIEKIQACTFVINELYSDTLMAGLDTEAAWFGKPSIIGGYNLEAVVESIQGYAVPPSYRIYPTKENLKKAIIHLLTDKALCKKIGQDAQDFVKLNWSSKAVAQKYLNIINDEIPPHVIRSADDDSDIYGAGITNDARKKNIRMMVMKYGEQSLCLENKPKLKEMIIKDCDLFGHVRLK